MSQEVRRFKRYPAYKDSGVEWLNDLPEHWRIKRLKSFASVRLSNVDKKTEEGQKSVWLCNYVDVYYNDRITRDLSFMAASATQEQVGRFSLRRGDVLITKDSESWDDIAVPALVADDLENVLCGYHLALVRPDQNAYGAYLARAFSATGVRDQFRVAANGITRFGIGNDAISSAVFPLPPPDEQCAIAGFLDRETARIDALVAKKERLIELLQEKRSALITRAVTKGLDPNVPMKDSGVEWFGALPEHWTTKQLRFAVTFQRGHDLPADEREEGSIPIISSAGPSGTHSRAIASGPGIVTGRYGTIGHFHLISGGYWPLNTTLYSIDLHANEPSFLQYMLTHLSPLFLLNAVKSAVPGIDRNDVHPILTGVPPITEQCEIVKFLDAASLRIDTLIGHIQRAIGRLSELRTALISAAVTGRIDVREEIP